MMHMKHMKHMKFEKGFFERTAGMNAVQRMGYELLPPPAAVPLPRGGRSWGFAGQGLPALPSIAYRGFAVAPMTLRAPSRRFLYNSGCRTYEKNFGATSLSTFTANQPAIPAR